VTAAQDLPLGVFDSGVGGLTVLREMRRQLPGESTIYLGDEARMPYGPRPSEEIVEFTREALRWFGAHDCKLIVLACNTATSVALDVVRDESPVPIIGVVRPGAAAAISASARRSIGVLATTATVRSGAYTRGVVQPVVDTLLLGCTHYPLLRSVIERVAGPGVRVVDSAATTALAVREVLLSHRLVRSADGPTHRVFATGSTERFRAVARTIFGEDLPTVERATLPVEAASRA
jgi:glutamate racemase